MLAAFAVFYPFAYSSLGSARMSFAGKQMGVLFSLVFIGLSPSLNIYEPLWRIWGVLLGNLVVAIVFFALWPEYAGNSLLPRLQKVLVNVLSLVPSDSAPTSEDQILKTNAETTHVLSEFLEIAEDARMEGRTCAVYHDVEPLTEFARARVSNTIRSQLASWLDFFRSPEWFSASAARAIAQKHSDHRLAEPLNEFSSRLEAGGFARLASWPIEPRRTMMAELQSMRRLEVLFSELNQYLSQVPNPHGSATRKSL
jgi:hypothetical protein